jgi:hypothetical protein
MGGQFKLAGVRLKEKILGAGLVLIMIGIVALAYPFLSLLFPEDREASIEAVILRNSLLAAVGDPRDFAWTPKAIPSSYLQESRQAPELFAHAIEGLFPAAEGQATVLERALTIARHLGSGPDRGDAIMSNTEHTYKTIIDTGGGYCSDYTQSFNALAMAAGLPVREWGIAFDRFGAGHAFNEVYDPGIEKWILIDSFWSLYIRDKATGHPLSALEFLSVLQNERDPDSIEFVPITEDRFGFKSAEDALAYYGRAKNQFFLWWGNNVWSYDAHPVVAWVGEYSRSLEQLVAMTIGIHPQIMIVPTAENKQLIEDLQDERSDFMRRVSGILALSLIFLGCSLALFRERRRKRRLEVIPFVETPQ